MLIQTEFDNPLEEDVFFEETEQTQEYTNILKNSENILKSFLYLKKIADANNPYVNSIIKMDTIDTTSGKTGYTISAETGKILIKNISSTDSYSIYFNGGEFVMFPYETLEIPVKTDSVIETKGKFSIIETEYKIGKGD